MKRPPHWHRVFFTALAIIVLDQLVKWWLLTQVDVGARQPIDLTSFLRIVVVWNHGVSFGMLAHGRADYLPYALIALALAISALLARLAFKSQIPLERAAYGLVIGGALGNVIDRLRFGAVADFFYFHLGDLGWPAFNVADSAICIGVCLLLFTMAKHQAQP